MSTDLTNGLPVVESKTDSDMFFECQIADKDGSCEQGLRDWAGG
jgi:hypothetical protein